jgi:hypothetical protein
MCQVNSPILSATLLLPWAPAIAEAVSCRCPGSTSCRKLSWARRLGHSPRIKCKISFMLSGGSSGTTRGSIHQLLNIILKLRILVLLPVSTMPYVFLVKNYS